MFSGRENPPRRFAAPSFDKGGFVEGTHPGSLEAAIQESTLIRLASLGTFPLVGGRLRATARVAPTAEKDRARWFGDGRRRSGTAPATIFFPLRPPVGPDGTALKHS